MNTESKNTGTGYPTDLRKSHLDNVTVMPTYNMGKAQVSHLRLRPVPLLTADHKLDVPVVCKFLSDMHDLKGQIRGLDVQSHSIPGLPGDASRTAN
eukprot:4750521-Pleurochrysis_carterae.AAC.1